MPNRHRSAWRRRWQEKSRSTRIAVSVAIPVAIAAVLGLVIAGVDGVTAKVSDSALANCVAPSAGAAAGAGASASPCPSATATSTATANAAAAAAPTVNPEAGRPDLAEANPVDPAGNAISLNQNAAQAANTLACTLTVPANPLSAQGLATPWQLGDGCTEANPNESAFVEATILAPNGQLQVYNPLVITQGTTPAAAPAAPTIPAGAQVIIDTGFNGNDLVLEGGGAAQGNCIDAFGNSIIAQTAACNAAQFYADANAQITQGTLKVPALGTSTDGKTCESTRSFSVIDQDQSDNVVSSYLLNGNGQTAQNSAANKNALAGATVLANGSDDGLLADFVDPALGCTPFQATDTTSPNGMQGAQALNELSARQNQHGTVALLPVNDPQLLVGGQFSIGKTNTYRMLTDQPLLSRTANKNQDAATYCQDMVNIAPAKLQLDAAKEANVTSPVPAVGNNLATFLGNRLSMSFANLNCQNFGLKDPVTVTANGAGIATAVAYSTAQQKATVTATGTCTATGTATPTATATASATPTRTATAAATPTATATSRFGRGRTGRGSAGPGTATSTGTQCSSSGAYDARVPHGRSGHRQNAAGM